MVGQAAKSSRSDRIFKRQFNKKKNILKIPPPTFTYFYPEQTQLMRIPFDGGPESEKSYPMLAGVVDLLAKLQKARP